MSDTNSSSQNPAEPPRHYSIVAGFLSYLVPGLGQIYQGRVGKGLLFMVCLLGMFYYGMSLGSWSNVFAPDANPLERHFRLILRGALLAEFDSTVMGSLWKRPPFAAQFWIGISAWPAILQYDEMWPVSEKTSPFWHGYQRERSEEYLNELQRNSDKGAWDLGVVCTVIAGVLNILVIYDAYAGPAFLAAAEPAPARHEEETVPA